MKFLHSTVLCLIGLTSVVASGNLRPAETTATTTGMTSTSSGGHECSHAKLFKAWTEEHNKDYATEESKTRRMKVWMANNSKSYFSLSLSLSPCPRPFALQEADHRRLCVGRSRIRDSSVLSRVWACNEKMQDFTQRMFWSPTRTNVAKTVRISLRVDFLDFFHLFIIKWLILGFCLSSLLQRLLDLLSVQSSLKLTTAKNLNPSTLWDTMNIRTWPRKNLLNISSWVPLPLCRHPRMLKNDCLKIWLRIINLCRNVIWSKTVQRKSTGLPWEVLPRSRIR